VPAGGTIAGPPGPGSTGCRVGPSSSCATAAARSFRPPSPAGPVGLGFSKSVARLVEPCPAGILIAAVTGPLSVLLDAGYALSLGLIARARFPDPPPSPARTNGPRRLASAVGRGLTCVAGHPYLRTLGTTTRTFNLFTSMTFAIGLLYVVRVLHLSAPTAGRVLAAEGAGARLGAPVTARTQLAVGIGPSISDALLLHACGLLPYPVGHRPHAAVVLGGVVDCLTSLHAFMWIGAFGSVCAIAPIALSPVRAVRDHPCQLAPGTALPSPDA